jgi:DNA (cytosine-5)-methyltransferase 1
LTNASARFKLWNRDRIGISWGVRLFIHHIYGHHVELEHSVLRRGSRLIRSSSNGRANGFVDLFAGCGGLSLGFKRQGFRPVGAVEIDTDAAETYRLNIHSKIHVCEIEAVESWPEVQVVIGGPPCQGFSLLGTRDPDDPRNELWRHFLEVVTEASAEVFVLENVPQFLRSEQYGRFQRSARRRGFTLSEGVLSAADFGVAQFRSRAFVIGSRLGSIAFPTPTHGPGSPTRAPFRTVRMQLTFEPALPTRPTGRDWHRARPAVKDFSRIRYAAVPKNGGSRFEMQAVLEGRGLHNLIPPCWRKHQAGTTDVFGRLWWDRPASTIRTEFYKPEKGRYLHPVADRPITVREAARLQSFPDDFAFPENQSLTSVARQIGNAVPPLLAEAVAGAVRGHLKARARLPRA